MIDLPQLHRVQAVRIAREGGVAWTPGLSRARSVHMASCGDAARRRIEAVLQDAARSAAAGSRQGLAADQRFYRVEVVMDASAAGPSIRFEVPESGAPEDLVQLWRSAE